MQHWMQSAGAMISWTKPNSAEAGPNSAEASRLDKVMHYSGLAGFMYKFSTRNY